MIAAFLKTLRRRPHREGAAHRNGGFTLVELLVSLVLLGLISVALAGSLRFGARVWDTGAVRGEWINRAEITQDFLRRQIGQAALRQPARDEIAEPGDAFADELDGAFAGTPGRLRFVAPAPAQAGVGGLSRFEIFLSEGAQSSDLVLAIGLLEADEEGAEDARVLIEGVETAQFTYYGALDGEREADWHDEWTDSGRLPALVSLRVGFPPGDRRVWPELIIATRLGDGPESRPPVGNEPQ